MTEKQPTRFQRANYCVEDIDRALTFYESVLGFEVTYRKGHNSDSYSIPLFEIPDGAELGFAILSLPNQPRVMALSLTQDFQQRLISLKTFSVQYVSCLKSQSVAI